VKWSSGLGIAISVITSVLIFVCLCLMLDVFVYRDTKTFRSASPGFCILILFGIVLCYISCYFWVGRPTKALCMLRPWMGGIGFIVVYSGILTKNYRIWRIFKNAKNLDVIPIHDSYLIVRGVLPMLVIELIILIVWTIVAPIEIEFSNNSFFLPYQVQVVCTQDEKTYILLGIYLGFKALLVLLGVIVAYQTRNVAANYNEAQAIGLATYLTVIIGVVALAICFTINNTVTANTAIPVFSIIIIISTTLFLLFFTKVVVVNIKGAKDLWTVNQVNIDMDHSSPSTITNNTWTSEVNSKSYDSVAQASRIHHNSNKELESEQSKEELESVSDTETMTM